MRGVACVWLGEPDGRSFDSGTSGEDTTLRRHATNLLMFRIFVRTCILYNTFFVRSERCCIPQPLSVLGNFSHPQQTVTVFPLINCVASRPDDEKEKEVGNSSGLRCCCVVEGSRSLAKQWVGGCLLQGWGKWRPFKPPALHLEHAVDQLGGARTDPLRSSAW